MTMRAAVVRHGNVVIENRPVPEPGPGQVLVRTVACGICGSDLHLVRHGARMMQMVRDLGGEPDNLVDGLIPGHEFVATIEAFGSQTRQTLRRGQRIVAPPFLRVGGAPVSIGASSLTTGAYAEYFLLDEASLLPVPETARTEAAALTEPVAIALHAVNRSGIKAGDLAVVIGCGPIGLAVITVLAERGIHSVIASDLSEVRRTVAAQLGASSVVDPRAADLWREVGPAPVHIFECTGARGMIHDLILRSPGRSRITVAGISSDSESILPMVAIAKEIDLCFVSFYSADEFAQALAMVCREHFPAAAFVTGQVGLAAAAAQFPGLPGDSHIKVLIEPARG